MFLNHLISYLYETPALMETNSRSTPKVFLAFSYPVMSFSIIRIIKKWKGISNIIPVNDFQELESMIKNAGNCIIIMDDGLKPLNNFHQLKTFTEENNHVSIFIFLKEVSVSFAKNYLSLNIKGVMPINCTIEEIRHALNIVLLGSTYFHADVIMNQNHKHANTPFQKLQLTPRESEFLHLLKCGYTTQYICSQMEISKHSLYKYKKNIKKKLLYKGYNGFDDLKMP